jgi:DNA repair protein RadA/Sms
MAVVSSFRNRYLPKGTIVFGEVGLTGEIRPVFNGEDRLKEAANHGFKHAIVPKANIGAWTKALKIKVTGVDTINQILDYI